MKGLKDDLMFWLEKPVRPAPRKLPAGKMEASFLSHMVEDAQEAYLSPAVSVVGALSNDYLVNVAPMLSPQATAPEFLMTNFEKAKLAGEGISKVSFENFKQRSGLDYNQLSYLLSVSRNTLINKKGTDTFDISISEKLIGLACVFTHGFDVFGSEEVFRRWLHRPVRALGGVTPYSFLPTQYGREEVNNILGRIEWGVYS